MAKINCSEAENFIREFVRMGKYYHQDGMGCRLCPMGICNNKKDILCHDFWGAYPQEAVAIVQKWSDEHPRKTRKEAFLEAFPDAETEGDYPVVIPCAIYGKTRCEGYCEYGKGCRAVWDEPAEVE